MYLMDLPTTCFDRLACVVDALHCSPWNMQNGRQIFQIIFSQSDSKYSDRICKIWIPKSQIQTQIMDMYAHAPILWGLYSIYSIKEFFILFCFWRHRPVFVLVCPSTKIFCSSLVDFSTFVSCFFFSLFFKIIIIILCFEPS